MQIYDITRTISPGLAVWPGDTQFQLTHNLRIEEGVPVNLTTLTLSAHTGTHADAYYHYEVNGAHPAQMPLKAYIGPARVIDVGEHTGPLYPQDLSAYDLNGVQRLLIRSHVSDLPDYTWPEVFPYLSVELISWLAANLGVVMIGLDSPSVDAFDSKDLPCHHALYRNGMGNLETLFLRDVPPGDYELIALPLKFDLACGSPVRAILRTLA